MYHFVANISSFKKIEAIFDDFAYARSYNRVTTPLEKRISAFLIKIRYFPNHFRMKKAFFSSLGFKILLFFSPQKIVLAYF